LSGYGKNSKYKSFLLILELLRVLQIFRKFTKLGVICPFDSAPDKTVNLKKVSVYLKVGVSVSNKTHGTVKKVLLLIYYLQTEKRRPRG